MNGIPTNLLRFLPYAFRLLFVAAACLAWSRFGHYFVSDAIAQQAITEHINNGEWAFAVNGYWSPLASWLLLPFSWLPVEGMDAFRLMNLVLAGICLHLSVKILKQLTASITIAYSAACAIAVILPFWALYYLTADILFLGVLLWYVQLHISGKFYERPVAAGISGTLLYFAKAYGLYFFIAHSLLMLLFREKDKRKQSLSSLGRALFIFIPVCAIWIALLSGRYGHFTISESARYNAAISANRPLLHPCDTMGLIAPLPGYRYSAWEDMTRHVSINKPAAAVPFTKRFTENTSAFISLLNKIPRYGIWLTVVLLAVVLFLKRFPKPLIVPLVTLCIFSGGYVLLFVEERYLIFPALLLYIIIAVLMVQAAGIIRSRYARWLLYFLLLYTLVRPAADIYRFASISEENAVHQQMQLLKKRKHPQNAAYASWNAYQFAGFAWYMRWKDYGGLKGYGADTARMRNDLQRNHIKYIIMPYDQLLPENLRPVYYKRHLPAGIVNVYERD